MNERTVFLQALELKSPAARAAFLDEQCAQDAVLRRRIEALLKAHEQSGGVVDALLGPDEPTSSMHSLKDVAPPERAVDPEDLNFLGPSTTPGCLGSLGPYEVIEVIGRGGMGLVFKARDTKLQRIVAIKVLAPEIAANKTAKRRFEREAQAAAAVSHDHIVTIHAVDEFNSLPYLVMECIVGRSLQQKIEETGPLELKEILRIGMQAALGLAAAHKQGLVHRDIKPANILLQNGIQRVKITDFGLARATDDVGMTHTGQIAGTPMYMSPEQAQGERVDHLSDLFSLGSVLYTLCTGRPAFRAPNTVAVLRRVVDDTPRPIREINSDLPSWLADIISKLMSKKKEERFQTASEVAELLSRRLARLQEPRSSTSTKSVPAASENPKAAPEKPKAEPGRKSAVNTKIGSASRVAATPRDEDELPELPERSRRVKPVRKQTMWDRIRGASPLTWLVAGVVVPGMIALIVMMALLLNRDQLLVRIELDETLRQQDVTLVIDGTTYAARDLGPSIRVKPGPHTLEVRRGTEQFKSEQFTIFQNEKPLFRVTVEEGRLAVVRADPGTNAQPLAGTRSDLPIPLPDKQRDRQPAIAAGAVVQPSAFSWPPAELVATIGDDSGYHWGAVWSVASNQDGTSFLSSGEEGFWYQAGENETPRHVVDPHNPAHQVLFHDELGYVTLHKNGQVQRWTFGPEAQRTVMLTVPERTRRIEFSPDANHVAVWVCPNDEPYGFADDHWPIKDSPQRDFVCTTGSVAILNRMPDGKFAESFRLEGCRRPALSRDGKTWSVYRIDSKRLECRELTKAGCPVVAELPQDDPVTSLVYLEDGRVTGLTQSGMLCLWRISGAKWDRVWETKGSTEPRWGFEVARHKPLAICFNFDGFRCVDLSSDNPDAPSATSSAGGIFHELRAYPKAAAFAGNGSRLTVGSLYGHVYRFEMAGPKLIEDKTTFRMPQVRFFIGMNRFCFSQDGSRFLCRDGGKVGYVFTWKMGGSAPTTIVNTVGNDGAGRRIHAVDREGRTAIVAYDGPDEPFSVWKNMGPQPTVLNLKQYINASAAVLSPDGLTVALGSRIGEVFLVDLSAPEPKELARVADLAGNVQLLGLSADRQRVVAVSTPLSNPKQVVLASLAFEQGKLRETFSEQAKDVVAHDLTLDGRWLALAHTDGRVSVYEVGGESWKLHGSWKAASAIHALSIAPDGNHVCTADHARTVRVCLANTGFMLREWRMPGRVHATAFVGDKDQVMTYNDNMTAFILKFGK